MKKLFIVIVFFISSFLCEKTFSQIIVSINIASQPIWGPVGYDYVSYYYLPDMDVYYYVPTQRYIYFYDGVWISRPLLPARFKGYNLYNARKVVINEPKPYLHHQEYRVKYASTAEFANQQSIRDSQDSKYFVNRSHPQHSKWMQSNGNQGKTTGNSNPGQKNGKSNNGKPH